jgi:hypothetical protein
MCVVCEVGNRQEGQWWCPSTQHQPTCVLDGQQPVLQLPPRNQRGAQGEADQQQPPQRLHRGGCGQLKRWLVAGAAAAALLALLLRGGGWLRVSTLALLLVHQVAGVAAASRGTYAWARGCRVGEGALSARRVCTVLLSVRGARAWLGVEGVATHSPPSHHPPSHQPPGNVVICRDLSAAPFVRLMPTHSRPHRSL